MATIPVRLKRPTKIILIYDTAEIALAEGSDMYAYVERSGFSVTDKKTLKLFKESNILSDKPIKEKK